MSTPTSEQLKKAGLVELPGLFPDSFIYAGQALANGHNLRTFNLCIQSQPETFGLPADPSITATNPVSQQIDWVRVIKPISGAY
jgi:hypothetical protein